MKCIFLDIDGVANIRVRGPSAGNYLLDRGCIERISHIIRETEAVIVLSSSWRHMILNGAMTCQGFLHMLRTHGLTAMAKMVGTTRADKDNDDEDTRARQIADWMRECKEPIESFVILDDDYIDGFGDKFIQTSHDDGVSDENVERAIELLGRWTNV